MGEPQRSDAVESDRRSSPRFPADLLGKSSVRLLGGSEVTLINFSERGILFQSETRLLVGARGTVRIVVGTETTIAAGTVVRSLVQGMASGKLAFHTALALDQPLALAAAVEARERAKAEAAATAPAPVVEAAPVEPVEPPPAPVGEAPASSGKTIEKRSHKGKPGADRRAADAPAAAPTPPEVDEVPVPAPAAEPSEPVVPVAVAPPLPVRKPTPDTGSGFDQLDLSSPSFGWNDGATQTAGLSVLFVSTTKDRTSRLQGILADHGRDIALTTLVHSKADAIGDAARQHDVLLFDFAIGPGALEKTLAALRTQPLGASIAIFVPQQVELPASVSSLANACVIDTTSGSALAAALRDAAWTPWQPVETSAGGATPREDLFWKAFDALPVPVVLVDEGGTIVHLNAACTKLANGVEFEGRQLASFYATDDAAGIGQLIADGFARKYDQSPTFSAPTADGASTVQITLQPLSVLPGPAGQSQLAMSVELRAEAIAQEPVAPAGPDLAADVASLTQAGEELTRMVEAAREELTTLRQELTQGRAELDEAREHGHVARRERDELRDQLDVAQRERDELRGRFETAQRDLERVSEQERAGATKLVELERLVADAARSEVAAARAQSQLAATTEELAALRNELDGQRMRVATQGVDAERTAAKYTAVESSARQAIDELKAARTEAQRLTRERDQALAAADAERARADAAVTAARDDAKKSRKIVTDDAVALTAAKLQRQVEELRAELQQEQDARKELEELLDQNAANLEQTIQDYEERLEALGAGVEDKRAPKPKKSRQG